MRKIASVLTFLIVLFLLVFYIRICLIRFNIISYKKELPLIGIQDVIKVENKIYIGLSQFNRIQVYHLNGQFIKFIPTSNHHKDFSFKVDSSEDVSIEIFYREKVKTVFPQDNITYFLKKKYPTHICSIEKGEKKSFIENDLFFLICNSDILLLILIVSCIGFFYIFNSSIIHKNCDGTQTKNLELYKKILIEIFK